MVVRKLPQKASSKQETCERFDQHAWQRLSALKTHAESARGKNDVGRTPFWEPKFGAQNGGQHISCCKGPKFWPQNGSSRSDVWSRCAFQKRFLRASQRFLDFFLELVPCKPRLGESMVAPESGSGTPSHYKAAFLPDLPSILTWSNSLHVPCKSTTVANCNSTSHHSHQSTRTTGPHIVFRKMTSKI